MIVMCVMCSNNLNAAHHTKILSQRQSRISSSKSETLHYLTKKEETYQETENTTCNMEGRSWDCFFLKKCLNLWRKPWRQRKPCLYDCFLIATSHCCLRGHRLSPHTWRFFIVNIALVKFNVYDCRPWPFSVSNIETNSLLTPLRPQDNLVMRR